MNHLIIISKLIFSCTKRLRRSMCIIVCGGMLTASGQSNLPVTASKSDLVFEQLATSWDEGIPLGNATVGALVWKKQNALRFSLDRTDLWDLRPMKQFSGEEYRFSWVKEQIRKNNYGIVQQTFDAPYDQMPAPSKIPGAALEFPLDKLGNPTNVQLYLNNALCQVTWPDGTQMQTFVHATKPIGWFVFTNLKNDLKPFLIAPTYSQSSNENDNSHAGLDLERLGYKQGDIIEGKNRIVYHQKGWGNFSYDVAVEWEKKGNALYGTWSVTSSLTKDRAEKETQMALSRGSKKDYEAHMKYWNSFWKQSSISVPDVILQKQYDNEMYKFASATREDSYPISLQAVWTADNGKLPPWKGDYHHDLNTQLSYWPTYTGNHLSEGLGYLNTLWKQRDTYKQYTRQYFQTEGMNIPGVATLKGDPMGGWIQYSMSPTVGAWLAQHFYLHWKYSADRKFLKEKAYPFIKDVAIYLEQQSIINKEGYRTLEFSSSPEIFDNSQKAWFTNITNYDLALMSFLFNAASELAGELKLNDEATHWEKLGKQLPSFDLDETGSLTFAKGVPYNSSHRHFSHAMAFHPLGLIDWSDGEKSRAIIKATIQKLTEYGPDYWTGYSYSWFANMKARALDGEGAAETLRTFAQCFCLKNTFHANGDQTHSGKSLFTYRPFTLEGNFAFAAGLQEMLLQSHKGTIAVFPAIPSDWKNVSFQDLRAVGAFLVSASKENGVLCKLSIRSEKGGLLKIASPGTLKPTKAYSIDEKGFMTIGTRPGEVINFK